MNLADKSGPEILAAVLAGSVSFDDLLVNDCAKKVRREKSAKTAGKKSSGKKSASADAPGSRDSSYRHVENLRANNLAEKIPAFLSWHATVGESVRAILAFSWYTPVFSRDFSELIPCEIPGIPTGVVADNETDSAPSAYRLEIVTRSGCDQIVSAEFVDNLAFTSIFNRGNVDEIRVFKLEDGEYRASSSMRRLTWLLLTRESFWMITRRSNIAWEIRPRHEIDSARALAPVYCEPMQEKMIHVIAPENGAYRVSQDSPWIVTGVYADRFDIKLRGIVARANMHRNVTGPILHFVGNRGDAMRGKRPMMRLSSYFARTAAEVPEIARENARVWNDAQGIQEKIPTKFDQAISETRRVARENPPVLFPERAVVAGIIRDDSGAKIGEIVSDGDTVVAESFVNGQCHDFKSIVEANFWINTSAGIY
jgi:hypothetical protein